VRIFKSILLCYRSRLTNCHQLHILQEGICGMEMCPSSREIGCSNLNSDFK
jgi:hypothetical protein